MGTVTLSGTVTVGPATSSGYGSPAAVNTVAFATSPTPKPATVYASETRNINSPSAYVEMSGIGPDSAVTRANFLYLKTSATMKVRLTMVDSPADLVAEEWILGLRNMEFPDDHALALLEVQGTGSVEYIASGTQ